MEMKIGFTGTRNGMTSDQKKSFRELITELKPEKFIHGDCVGADADAHKIATELDIPVIIYPPRKNDLRAYCKGETIMPVGDYLDRNIKIIDACDLLLATPQEYTNQHRSGTWFTVRQAKKRQKPVKVILPNGKLS